jgi:hypothetical protein
MAFKGFDFGLGSYRILGSKDTWRSLLSILGKRFNFKRPVRVVASGCFSSSRHLAIRHLVDD